MIEAKILACDPRAEWERLKTTLTPQGWNAGESSTFYGFFLHGWYGRTGEAAYQQQTAGDRHPEDDPNAGNIAGSVSANGSTDHWRQLAIAAMKVNDYRPHPREWWNDEMKPDREAEYSNAMKQVAAMKMVLGL